MVTRRGTARGVDFTLPSGVEQQSLTGSQPLHGTGNEFAKLITSNDAANLLDGAAGADRVNGAAGDDVLVYDALDELLDGGTGVDTLRIAGSLRVSGDAGDSLTSLAQGWTADGGDAQIIDGVHYQSYSAGNAHLLVDLDLLTSTSLS